MVEYRSPKPVVVGSNPSAPASLKREKDEGMAKGLGFIREVRQEAQKVTWPTRKEVVLTTIVVFIMIFIMAMILLFADFVISNGIEFILGK